MIALLFAFLLPAGVQAGAYIGAERCQGCHPNAYKIWSQSAHARALDAMADNQKNQARCTICHTMSPEQVEPLFANVQCESCHGAGKFYAPIYVMKDKELARAVGLVDAPSQTCRRCHDNTTPSIEAFDYKKAWQRIAHGKD